MSATLVYDGDCGVCTAFAGIVVERVRPASTAIVAWQQADLATLGLTPAQCREALQFVAASSSCTSGWDAVATCLRRGAGGWMTLGRIASLRPVRWVATPVYRCLARNRHRLRLAGVACRCSAPDSCEFVVK